MMYEEEPERRRNSPIGPILAAIITAIGGIIIVYVQFVVPQKLAIHATQTAEERQTVVLPTKISPPEIESSITPPALATASPNPTSTPAVALTPLPEIFSTDKLTGLKNYNSPKSIFAFDLVPGIHGDGLEISYTLEAKGWVGVFRMIEPDILADTRGIRFSYRGNGAPNTLEIKLEYKQGTVFSVLLPHLSDVPDWQTVEVLYTDLTCWVGTPGCPDNLSLNFETDKVIKIGFAISNKPDFNDEPGSGKVFLDQVELIP